MSNILVNDSLPRWFADVSGHSAACADDLHALHGRRPQEPRSWRVHHIWLQLPGRGEASKRAAVAGVLSGPRVSALNVIAAEPISVTLLVGQDGR